MSIACQLFPTIITPFSADRSIDYTSLGRLIDYLFLNQVDGLFAVCQSSEMFWLSEDEKLELAAFCIARCRAAGRQCVVSGHTQDDPETQIAYLKNLEKLAPDAIILVTNRLAGEQESDERLIENLAKILRELDPGTRLGLYECPHPYKRLLTDPVLAFVRDSGRFDFIKDTSCQIGQIGHRLRLLEGSDVRLYNANAATLWESLTLGVAGFSGVMLNFMPDVFLQLKRYLNAVDQSAYRVALPSDKRSAQSVASFIALASVFEYQNYPANAKVFLQNKGIIACADTRSGSHLRINESQRKELTALANQIEKFCARVDLFTDRELVFAPFAHFQSCHASTVLPLKDGTILMAYFAGTAEGHDDVGIWLSRKVDGCWQEPRRIDGHEPVPHWNPVLFPTSDGVRLVYKVGRRIFSWQSRTISSSDQGVTWTDPQPFPADNEAGGPVRSKPIRLSNGLLLAPNSDETSTEWHPRVDCSDDDGRSFARLAAIPININAPDQPNHICGKGAIQPTLWESRPGHVHALLRTSCGSIFRSDSEDYGRTWCEAYNSCLPNNNSGIEIAQDGDVLYLILNPIAGNWADRNPIVVKRSLDNGRTFTHFLTLDHTDIDPVTQTSAEYAYPSAVVQDHVLHVAYTFRRQQMAYCRIELRS